MLVHNPDGSVDFNKSGWSDIIRLYSSEIMIGLVESGSAGVKAKLREFYVITYQRVSEEAKATNDANIKLISTMVEELGPKRKGTITDATWEAATSVSAKKTIR